MKRLLLCFAFFFIFASLPSAFAQSSGEGTETSAGSGTSSGTSSGTDSSSGTSSGGDSENSGSSSESGTGTSSGTENGSGTSSGSSTVSKDSSVVKINSSMESILNNLEDIVLENSTLLNNQADAYIGKIFPAFPPHFSVGLTTTGTVIDTSFIIDGVQTLFDQIKASLEEIDGEIAINFSLPGQFVLPAAAIRGRVGGVFLPFDVGLFYSATFPGMFDSLSFDDFSGGISYTAFGADLRYAILEGNLILPQVSLGAGYIYQKESVNFSAKKTISYTGQSEKSGTLSTEADLSLFTNTVYLQAQISKQIFITTPYAGAKVSLTQSQKDYSWNYKTVIDGTKSDSASKNGKESISRDFDMADMQVQLFGGATLNLFMFELSLCAAWNPVSNYFSGAISTNFKM